MKVNLRKCLELRYKYQSYSVNLNASEINIRVVHAINIERLSTS